MQLTADQKELQDLVRRFFLDCVPPEYIRARITSLLRRDDSLWASLKELGLDEGFGGEDPTLSFAELGVISEEVGRAIFPESLIECLYGRFIVPNLLMESRKAYEELLGSVPVTAIAPESCCHLVVDKKRKRVSGRVSWVFGGEGASAVLTVIRLQGHRRIVVIGVGSPGVTSAPVPSLDRTAALTTYELQDVTGLVLSVEESSRVLDCYEILKACEVYGIGARVLEMTVDYVKTREQFGVPVGAFQAIQHRLADAYAANESLGALCRFAAWSVKSSPSQTPLTAKASITHAAEVGPMVCESALQCHGGIGFTWEYDLHLYLRRAKAIQAAFPISESCVDDLLSRAQAESEL